MSGLEVEGFPDKTGGHLVYSTLIHLSLVSGTWKHKSPKGSGSGRTGGLAIAHHLQYASTTRSFTTSQTNRRNRESARRRKRRKRATRNIRNLRTKKSESNPFRDPISHPHPTPISSVGLVRRVGCDLPVLCDVRRPRGSRVYRP